MSLLLGLVCIAFWLVIAVPPFFETSHEIVISGHGGGLRFPASDFVAGEVVAAILFLGLASGALWAALSAGRPPAPKLAGSVPQDGEALRPDQASFHAPGAPVEVGHSEGRTDSKPRSRANGVREGVFDLSGITPVKQRRWAQQHFASRIRIDGSGVTVEYPDSTVQSFQWTDPDLGFYLVDYRAPVARKDRWSTPAQAKVTPFYLLPDRWNRPLSRATAVWITEAAYQALYDSGFALRLHVSTGGGRSWPHDAVITIFQRKRFSWLVTTELNPDAE